MKIFTTGTAGYCGSVLIPKLLRDEHEVTVYDIGYFGFAHLEKHPNLTIIKADIRDTKTLEEACAGHEIFLHLACISNDSSFALDEKLSTSVNLDAFEPMVLAAKRSGIRRFIYASSSSVYGVSKEKNVTEDHPLVPLTLYNKYKGMCEPLLLKHTTDDFTGVIFRPATVCGYAPRLRLDLTVNILTYQATKKGKITVFGGSQLRPNLHIWDYCRAVMLLMSAPKDKVANQIFNVGAQNMSILEIALLVADKVKRKPIEIEIQPSGDLRSYHINSDKIKDMLGFVPELTVEDAIVKLSDSLTRTDLPFFWPSSLDDPWFYNVQQLKRINAE